MRNLTSFEKNVLLSFSEKLNDDEKHQFLNDLENACSKSGGIGDPNIVFEIKGYERPTYSGQSAFPVEGRMLDKDGVEINVIVYADQNGRLLELEFIRWADDEPKDPQIDTLQIY